MQPAVIVPHSVRRRGYEVTIFGPEAANDLDPNQLDMSALVVSDEFDGKFWHNDLLQTIEFERYQRLTDEQIYKYGMLWMAELFSGDMTSSFWFAEWTLMLALQLKSPHDMSVPLFADFLEPPRQEINSLFSSYETKYRNLAGGSDAFTEEQLTSWLVVKAQQSNPNYAWNEFLMNFMLMSTNNKAMFISLLALLTFRYCSEEDTDDVLPPDLYAQLGITEDVLPPAHCNSREVMKSKFTPYGDNSHRTLLRSIIVPSLAIYLRVNKTPPFMEIRPAYARIRALLELAVLNPFKFRELYIIKSYLAACEMFNCHDGSFLAEPFDGVHEEYAVLNEFHSVYAKNDPSRSCYPWSRCLDLAFLSHYSDEANPWMCALLTALLYGRYHDIWQHKHRLRDSEWQIPAIRMAEAMKRSFKPV